ncbi:hypothetical protein ILUMI_21978 [Ignelater luminosus]|uniref:Uncharacterized protein n=1 Tax=Ignelater luminosus TaxID=2038154 RepID=A0A8K0CEP2_IGNLU|nr:hypothetical protein ILUMI_21978 [Ignelater luminosus]
MKTIIALLSIFAISQAASIIPVDTSVVNVKTEHSGQDYSYSIHENRGYAINPAGTIHPGLPIIKTIPSTSSIIHLPEHAVRGENHHPEQKEVKTQVVTKTLPGHVASEHEISVAGIPKTYLGYVPISYQYEIPYGYSYPYNLLYRIA